jgi:hypothetical protein
MVRRLIWVPVLASCLGVASAAPEPRPNASAVCLYDSKAYSEGAFVCVQKSLMLKCTADGPHLLWKVVPDEDISDRCTAPTVQHTPPEPRAHPHRRRHTVRNRRPLIDDPAKCFVFNGVQYCE